MPRGIKGSGPGKKQTPGKKGQYNVISDNKMFTDPATGLALFVVEKNGPPPPTSYGAAELYKPRIKSLLDGLKIGDPFVLPIGAKSVFSTTHQDGGYGYSFRWQVIEPDKKFIRGWRVK